MEMEMEMDSSSYGLFAIISIPPEANYDNNKRDARARLQNLHIRSKSVGDFYSFLYKKGKISVHTEMWSTVEVIRSFCSDRCDRIENQLAVCVVLLQRRSVQLIVHII